MPRAQKFRRFCWTLFDEEIRFPDVIAGIPAEKLSFFVGQRERCPNTGKIHWQAYCRLSQQISFTTIKTWLPRAHIENAKGNEAQNIAYCTKADSRVSGPYEQGDRAMPGKRKDIDTVRDLVKAGKRICEIADQVSSYQALRFAEKYITLQPVQRREAPLVYWFHGSTDSGKTREAWRRAEEVGADVWCSHDTLQWFDGYTGQKYVIIDDIRGSSCKFSFLLKLLDRYPLMVPIKGGYVRWLPEVIVITSPRKPKYLYNKGPEDVRQLTRRIHFVEQFGSKVLAHEGAQAEGFVSVN